MVISCSVPTCKNRFQKGGDVQFHSFPLRREDMSRRWAEAIGRHDWLPTKNSFVCSQHFTMADYQIRPGKHKHFLREEAVPSIFTPSPTRKRTMNTSWGRPVHPIPNVSIHERKLPFILPSHLEIKSHSPSPPMKIDTTVDLFPTTLPSGVSITPLKRNHPKPDPMRHRDSYPFSNGSGSSPFKRMRNTGIPMPKPLPMLHPSNNTSVFLTNTKSPINYTKPMPNLTPIYPKYDSDQNENGDEEPVDVNQFLSISLQPEEEKYDQKSSFNYRPIKNDHPNALDNLKRKCSFLQKEIQKRDSTIKSMQYQMRDMRKKMDSISIKKILNDSFTGITFDILNNYLNNTYLDSCEKVYSSNVKEFSKKLYALSPDAYALVRSQFDLPHHANVSHWLRLNKTEEELYEMSRKALSDGEEDDMIELSQLPDTKALAEDPDLAADTPNMSIKTQNSSPLEEAEDSSDETPSLSIDIKEESLTDEELDGTNEEPERNGEVIEGDCEDIEENNEQNGESDEEIERHDDEDIDDNDEEPEGNGVSASQSENEREPEELEPLGSDELDIKMVPENENLS